MHNHAQKYKAELDQLCQILKARNLSSLEYLAAERSLQVSIEACIGIAKHWSKKLAGYGTTEAYDSFELLSQHNAITISELETWRKIIGLRNALVHDYLNTDPQIIRTVIKSGQYQILFGFLEKGLKELNLKINTT